MSHDVDHWNTKQLENLRIPLASLFEYERPDWHPERINNDDGTVSFDFGDGSTIEGEVEDADVIVSEIDISGEGSGSSLGYVIEPALAKSMGKLIASRVWECGAVDRLIVVDGEVTTEDIDI